MNKHELEQVLNNLADVVHDYIISRYVEVASEDVTHQELQKLHRETEPLYKILDAVEQYKRKTSINEETDFVVYD